MIKDYKVSPAFFDEMFADVKKPHQHYKELYENISLLDEEVVELRYQFAQQNFLKQGITFIVYNNVEGTDRTMPFDPLSHMRG